MRRFVVGANAFVLFNLYELPICITRLIQFVVYFLLLVVLLVCRSGCVRFGMFCPINIQLVRMILCSICTICPLHYLQAQLYLSYSVDTVYSAFVCSLREFFVRFHCRFVS